ncbi:GNAT family N-acetyltransferase [Salinisphaera sp. SPP-AMP-43]|uniref:GNAT family N-acetyltransferase n=1 Tax=Salinisphaera sp. SPP-AMP-43 TaxID=3121288 RepID=UPI003C6DD374
MQSAPRQAMPAVSAGRIDAELSLRAAETADYEPLFAWYREALRRPIDDLQGWDEAARRADFQRLMGMIPTFVVRAEAIEVGFVQVWPRADVLHLVNIVIAVEARGRRIGARVLAWLQQRAREAGGGVHLKVLRTNPGVLDFYRRAGFGIERCTDEYWWLDWPAPG